jgi:hypothetical protein
MQNNEIIELLENFKAQALQDLVDNNISIDFQEATFEKQEILFNKVSKCITNANTIQEGIALVLSDVEITNAVFDCFKGSGNFYKKDNGAIVPLTKDAFDKNKELKKVFTSIKTIGLIMNIDFFLLNIIRLLPQSQKVQTNNQVSNLNV